jgi:hypothetical protein
MSPDERTLHATSAEGTAPSTISVFPVAGHWYSFAGDLSLVSICVAIVQYHVPRLPLRI